MVESVFTDASSGRGKKSRDVAFCVAFNFRIIVPKLSYTRMAQEFLGEHRKGKNAASHISECDVKRIQRSGFSSQVFEDIFDDVLMPFEIRGEAWDKQYYPEGVCSFTMYLEDYNALKERFPMSRMALDVYKTAKERNDYIDATIQKYSDDASHDVFEPRPPYFDA